MQFGNKFEAVVLTYIVSQILTIEEKANVICLFEELDTNHDGVINAAEFRQALANQNNISA